MGSNKIGVSDFALTVSAAIRAQMGIRRISNREIAKLIDRGATYVNSRIKDENEWALGDIEKLCELWNMTPCELIESVNSEQSRVAKTINKLKRGDLDIAAYEDDHKFDGAEMTPHDESAPDIAAHELRADAHGPVQRRTRPARGQHPPAR